MKQVFYIILFLCMSTLIYSQTLNVHKTDGSTQSFTLSEIDSITFTAVQQFICGSSQVFYGSKLYNTVLIGSQCWLKENLNIGTRIDGGLDQTSGNGIEKYCYDNLEAYCDTLGGLYQWNEAMQYVTTEGTRGICPQGWHIPNLAEFQTLYDTVGGDGNALKAIGEDATSTDTSGFSALLAGSRDINGNFQGLGSFTFFWSSTEAYSTSVYHLSLFYYDSNILLGFGGKAPGFSVRCLKD